MSVKIIGAGLAGCEAAWQLAECGIPVELFEMKPTMMSPAHASVDFAELVCSNSLRSSELSNAVGLLKEEMRRLGSLIIRAADETKIAAGGALAVDRVRFSEYITKQIMRHPLITVRSGEATEIPEGRVIIATGPLTSDAFADKIAKMLGNTEFLSFFDAAAPIVTYDSIDMEHAYMASRYGKGDADYINCPMDLDQYTAFTAELTTAETAHIHGFEKSLIFEGCMPIEIMAGRGADTMRFGPLKPVGLLNPRNGKVPHAVVQLRRDNAEGTLYNLVGFQTHLKFSEQKRIFSMIYALRDAEFVRYGVMHRNTYLNSPKLLDRYYRLISDLRISFAGQITGVEGYVESASSGLLVGLELSRELLGKPHIDFPKETAIGALALYISGGSVSDFQPMNVNFGLIEPLGFRVRGKKEKNLAISARSLDIIDGYGKQR
ncbi:MAG: methylenetetrahydrofolate--tRNA-(uracil(54)-C(5))-methyltransferase (FADH(2)-oxidizing) TrmFO [Oscillospiraceae bacterium]|nr:methylenetetrahydrofolate--tRNA-(uracil(54)-C(5))-methyltransferase (FADH(2)-oxidizing) TrmFO [Oscillospiraceae bacterium]MCL2278622.1 methylenetetrahydrofolate--tRNA-(uracil(54)-C(5))-methyltransferase (FADH(2)-oxidizing) TrmFO [Oscillospiraceae bacterium]